MDFALMGIFFSGVLFGMIAVVMLILLGIDE